MTDFEREVIVMMKCLNKRLSEIADELHEMNGYAHSLYEPDEDEGKDSDD